MMSLKIIDKKKRVSFLKKLIEDAIEKASEGKSKFRGHIRGGHPSWSRKYRNSDANSFMNRELGIPDYFPPYSADGITLRKHGLSPRGAFNGASPEPKDLKSVFGDNWASYLCDYPSPPFLHLLNNLAKLVHIKELGDNNVAFLLTGCPVSGPLNRAFNEGHPDKGQLHYKSLLGLSRLRTALGQLFPEETMINGVSDKHIILYFPDVDDYELYGLDILVKNHRLAKEFVVVFDDTFYQKKSDNIDKAVKKYFNILYMRDIPRDKELRFLDTDCDSMDPKLKKKFGKESRLSSQGQIPDHIFESSGRNWWLGFRLYIIERKVGGQ